MKPKIFIPLIDNGSGGGKLNWTLCMMTAFNGRSVHIHRVSDSHANRAMNNAFNTFLLTDCDEVFVIDADVIFSKQHVDWLFSHNVPLVYGVYPKKQDETPPCVCAFPDGVRQHDEILIEVRRAGRGFMRVKRELVEAMKEENGGPALRYHNHGRVEWDFFPSGPVEGAFSAMPEGQREWISEDWFFCERARALGFPTLIDPRIALQHEGDKVYSFSQNQMGARIATWEDVPGWFTRDDASFYRWLTTRIPAGGRFAEIGVFRGRSLAAFYSFLEGKTVEVHAVDTFEGSPGVRGESVPFLREMFNETCKSLGLSPIVHETRSNAAALTFPDDHFDAVFIDTAHDANSVKWELSAWFPKVKPGGIICGHDADYPAVKGAVYGMLPKAQEIGRCWYAVK